MKFRPPAADTDDAFDMHRWTLEVSNFTKPAAHEKQMGTLHLSMIPLMVACKVPLDNIVAVMSEGMASQQSDMVDILNDSVKAMRWLKRHNSAKEHISRASDHDDEGHLPHQYVERMRYLLERGFAAKDTPFLANLIESLAQEECSKASESTSYRFCPLGFY